MVRIFTIAILLIVSSSAFSQPGWYAGEINRIWPHDKDGGFIVTFSGPSSLDDCKYKYAYFRLSEIGPQQLKNAYSLALSAFMAGTTVGIVIDKELDGEYCHAYSIDIRK